MNVLKITSRGPRTLFLGTDSDRHLAQLDDHDSKWIATVAHAPTMLDLIKNFEVIMRGNARGSPEQMDKLDILLSWAGDILRAVKSGQVGIANEVARTKADFVNHRGE